MTRKAPKIIVTTLLLSSTVAIASVAPTVASGGPGGPVHAKKAKRRIAIVRYKPEADRSQIVTMDEDGKHPKTLKSRKIDDNADLLTSAALSPDGKRIVYTEGVLLDGAQIWSMKANGKGAKKIVDPPGQRSVFSPSWSPDGKKIVYTLTDNDTFASLIVADADGKHPKKVYKSTNSYEVYPSWSPDGKRIVFSVRSSGTDARGGKGSTYRVATVKSSGGGFHFLTKVSENRGAMAGGYSPDGKRIVYMEMTVTSAPRASAPGLGPITQGSPPNTKIVTIKTNGKDRKVFDTSTKTFGRVIYSSDGKRILASRIGDDTIDLFARPLGGGAWKRVTHTKETYNLFDFFQVLSV